MDRVITGLALARAITCGALALAREAAAKSAWPAARNALQQLIYTGVMAGRERMFPDLPTASMRP
jgi:hypothetical protein